MAEVVGLVASSVTLAGVAIKIGGAVFKLKGLWDEIQDVPQTIAYLMKQIEIADSIVSEMENEVKEHARFNPMIFDDTAMRNSTGLCRHAVQDLINLADDLRIQIDAQRKIKRGIAKVKVRLKKEVLAEHEKRLRDAFSIMAAAQHSYMMVKLKFLPHVIVQQLRESQNQSECRVIHEIEDDEESTDGLPCSSPKHDQTFRKHRRRQEPVSRNGSACVWPSQNRSPQLPWQKSLILGHITSQRTDVAAEDSIFQQTSYTLRFQLPSWLSAKAWDIQANRAVSGWRIHLRTWNTVDRSRSLAFTAVEDGDATRLREVFHAGLAGPFERDAMGETLLHRARDAETVKILLAAGLQFGEHDYDGDTAIYHIITSSREPDAGLAALLVSSGVFEEYLEYGEPSDALLDFASSGLQQNLTLSLNRMFSSYYDLPFAMRVRKYFSRHLYFIFRHGLSPEAFLWSLWADGRVGKEDIRQLEEDDVPFKNVVAFVMSTLIWPISEHDSFQWQAILLETMQVTGNLHTFRRGRASGGNFWYLRYQSTPLICFILGAAVCFVQNVYWIARGFRAPRFRGFKKHMQSALEGWLSVLKGCKVDLIEYGKRERNALRKNRILTEARLSDLTMFFDWRKGPDWKLKDIRYGPNPEDWSLVWVPDMEEFAGEFWNLVEEPRFPVPGEWIDD